MRLSVGLGEPLLVVHADFCERNRKVFICEFVSRTAFFVPDEIRKLRLR